MSPKYGCNNLYFHPYNLPSRYKLLFYLTSLSCRGPVNTSTPTFSNINFTKAIKNLPVSNVTDKWLQ